jgi:hypothetical protein
LPSGGYTIERDFGRSLAASIGIATAIGRIDNLCFFRDQPTRGSRAPIDGDARDVNYSTQGLRAQESFGEDGGGPSIVSNEFLRARRNSCGAMNHRVKTIQRQATYGGGIAQIGREVDPGPLMPGMGPYVQASIARCASDIRPDKSHCASYENGSVLTHRQ